MCAYVYASLQCLKSHYDTFLGDECVFILGFTCLDIIILFLCFIVMTNNFHCNLVCVSLHFFIDAYNPEKISIQQSVVVVFYFGFLC